jgi:hypothetical protein
MEGRFNHDFSRVRVHTDARAFESARAVGALAYTVGPDIAFADGQYAPLTGSGQQLIAHELTHVVQQEGRLPDDSGLSLSDHAAEHEATLMAEHAVPFRGESAPPRINQHVPALARQQGQASATPGGARGMSRIVFEQTMKRRFLVNRIAAGTMQEQATSLTPRGGAPAGGIQLPNWQAWDPGPSSVVYDRILESLENFATSIGGVPQIQEITFYQTDYTVSPAGIGVPNAESAASFGAGHLTIYRSLATSHSALPIGRSNAQGNYPPVSVVITGTPGQTPGAPLAYIPPEESSERAISHELGHGLAEAASAAVPGALNDYRRSVGWLPGHPTALYDVGVSAVEQALASGQPPPAGAQPITENNWNAPTWVEQPLSHYSVAGGPAEDFAEAVMTFVHQPNLLVSRSPHRFAFINSGKDVWLPQLLRLPLVGDFPQPRGKDRAA